MGGILKLELRKTQKSKLSTATFQTLISGTAPSRGTAAAFSVDIPSMVQLFPFVLLKIDRFPVGVGSNFFFLKKGASLGI